METQTNLDVVSKMETGFGISGPKLVKLDYFRRENIYHAASPPHYIQSIKQGLDINQQNYDWSVLAEKICKIHQSRTLQVRQINILHYQPHQYFVGSCFLTSLSSCLAPTWNNALADYDVIICSTNKRTKGGFDECNFRNKIHS